MPIYQHSTIRDLLLKYEYRCSGILPDSWQIKWVNEDNIRAIVKIKHLKNDITMPELCSTIFTRNLNDTVDNSPKYNQVSASIERVVLSKLESVKRERDEPSTSEDKHSCSKRNRSK